MDFLRRFWRHVLMNPLAARRAFSASTFDAIQREVALLERTHRGELRFVVEAELTHRRSCGAGLSSRDRARELFASYGVWNTEENCGVLVYVLLADRCVEIVADRGIERKVAAGEWDGICRVMEAHFRERHFEEGALAGLRAVSSLLQRHFPPGSATRNELPDRPLMI